MKALKGFLLPHFDAKLTRALFGEFFATFLFMFAICGVGLANPDGGAVLSGVCCAFAAVGAIYGFGDLSGAHFNPAVTFGAMMGARMPVAQGLMYWLVQLTATFLVIAILQLLHPSKDVFAELVVKAGEGVADWQVVLMECILTFLLVIVIYGTVLGGAPKLLSRAEMARDVEADRHHDEQDEQASGSASTDPPKQESLLKKVLPLRMGNEETVVVRPTALFAGLAIGFTLGFLCFLGGPVSGGAFNPARATAPAIIAREWGGLWRYWVGDLTGALLAAIVYNLFMAEA
jgi:aquaporin related protein